MTEKSNIAYQDIADIARIRADFPVLAESIHGKPLVYFDNGASAQKPKAVIDAVEKAYSEYYSNVHRGIHYLSDKSTRVFEETRALVHEMLNAEHEHEIIYTKGTTDGINLVAHSFCKKYLKTGDEILISEMEHHSNIVPWQIEAESTGAKVRAIPVLDDGSRDMDAFGRMISEKVRIVALTHVSNTLGTVNPVKEIIEMAHAHGVPVLLDGAQGVPHMKVDVRDLDVDFYVFSGHKVFGPTGTGILYGKEKWLNEMPPYQGGGNMIDKVTIEKTTWNVLPHKFEAGTPHIAGMIGLKPALEYVLGIGYDRIEQHEHALTAHATESIKHIPGLKVIGTAAGKASVLSFVIDGMHPSDIGTLLDMQGIAVRTGHHCNQPLMQRFNIPATVRASFAFYNTHQEVEYFAKSVQKAVNMLK